MSGHRLEQQYLKLLQQLGSSELSCTLQELATRLCCTRRHMRNLLNQMQAQGWIRWHSEPGRGRRSRLQLLYSQQQLLSDRADQLLGAGHIAQAVALLGEETRLLAPLLRARLGHQSRADRQVLRVPYYRPMPNLYPGTPLRRSEVHLVRQIFNGLTRINEENGEVEADLAHHWQQLDPLCWRFYLRPAVLFHDGRELEINDVQLSLQRCAQLPLYQHLQRVEAEGARTLLIHLSAPDPRLPWLLADSAAMILPADHGAQSDFASRPIGTGPYRVAANDAWQLQLQAFDGYFGFRALLDEVDIWMWPDLAEQLELGERQVCGLDLRSADNPLASASGWDVQLASLPQSESPAPSAATAEMVLEQGGYFLLCDGRSPHWQEAAKRSWLQQVLDPYALMQQVPLAVRRYWAPAGSLLPIWLHTSTRSVQMESRPTHWFRVGEAAPKLRLAYYEQQPEYRLLARVMASLLAEQGVTLELLELDYACWSRGEAEVDLWLGSVNFAAPLVWSVGAWLLGTPLLRQGISGGDPLQLAQWHQAWRSEVLSSEQLVRQIVDSGWLQPLFHHWLRLQGPAQARGIRLNNLGWFDFKSAWLAPE